MHINIVSVPVSDQDRAKDFYVGQLGFELRADNPMGEGQRWLQVGPPGR
jgi:catechol 2,3-dioxygenase-like lactoylglutathione lyase family enzyme